MVEESIRMDRKAICCCGQVASSSNSFAAVFKSKMFKFATGVQKRENILEVGVLEEFKKLAENHKQQWWFRVFKMIREPWWFRVLNLGEDDVSTFAERQG